MLSLIERRRLQWGKLPSCSAAANWNKQDEHFLHHRRVIIPHIVATREAEFRVS
jgi:hypothetical protein